MITVYYVNKLGVINYLSSYKNFKVWDLLTRAYSYTKVAEAFTPLFNEIALALTSLLHCICL